MTDDGFETSDFAYLHDSLMAAVDNEKLLDALLSNNFNVILAALKRCAAKPLTAGRDDG